jgi:hypothetical protein
VPVPDPPIEELLPMPDDLPEYEGGQPPDEETPPMEETPPV